MAIPKEILNSKDSKDLEDYKRDGEVSEESALYVKPPGFIEMARNFTKSAVDFIKSGAAIVSKTVYINRLATCNSCEYLIRKSMRCKSCGCLLEAKARMESAYCPLGKWENGTDERVCSVKK